MNVVGRPWLIVSLAAVLIGAAIHEGRSAPATGAPGKAKPAASQPAAEPAATEPPAGAGKAAEVYTDWPFDAKEAVKRQEGTAKTLGIPKEVSVDLGKKVMMKFILIPAGKFMMGAPGAPQETTIDKPYYMAIYKVTEGQYLQVMGKDPSPPKGKPDFPVSQVTWKDAEDFCQAASKKTGRAIRLPTDAEWENACRAGANTRFFWGNDGAKLGDYAWYRENNGGQMHPVGQKKPNAWGLYDINGLMWEYCGPAHYDAEKSTEKDHDCRGATWGSRPPMFVMGTRMDAPSDAKAPGLDRFGMRVAMDVALPAR